jgi:hypothetical protein
MCKSKASVGVLSFIFLFLITSVCVLPQEKTPRSKYLEYARKAADDAWEKYDLVVAQWKESFDPENVFGYRPPGSLLEMAVIFAFLSVQENNAEYAQRSKKILLTYGDFRSLYPQWAVERRPDYDERPPVLPDFFTVMRYIRAYDLLNNQNVLTQADRQKITKDIAESLEYLLRTQEWGPMNRSALRAESLAWAVRAFPDHPDVRIWEMQRRAIGDDNWGNWQIEDATIYHAVWLYALIGYADAMGKLKKLFETPEMYYYAHYFLKLMSPDGMIPDFGDANWQSNWSRFLVFFETAAALYKNPHMKWAASTIAEKFIDFSAPNPSIGLGYMLLDCYRWADDDIPVIPPETLSQEVMEDVQGKKIVFRNGWDKHATYLLLNYRDEGDGGLNFREYLRDTIPVEEEKMTHGHADENSIVLLMSGGSVLLHDGGYRDYMPSGPFGAYRQDYFHNRLCVRPEKIWMGQKEGEHRYSISDAVPGQPVLDFLRNAGSYRIVRTQKVDFLTLPDLDYSRTRLLDGNMGYEWDRVITHIKDPGIFVVFDIFKSRKEEYFTLSNLWHTRQIIEQGAHWYDTVYDRIQKNVLSTDNHLVIVFPSTHYRLEGIEKEMRHYQDELLIHQTTAQHFELGDTVGFITVLIPHKAAVSARSLVDKIHLLPIDRTEKGMGVAIKNGEKTYHIGVKNDLRMDIVRDWRRPRYTYESGKIRFGDMESNGDLVFYALHKNTLDYTIVNLTRAEFADKVLVSPKPSFFGLAFDGSPPDRTGVGKLRYWCDTILLK